MSGNASLVHLVRDDEYGLSNCGLHMRQVQRMAHRQAAETAVNPA